MTESLTEAAPAVQGEALGILTSIVEAEPKAVQPALNSAISLLSDDTHQLLRNETLEFLAAVAKHDTEAVVDSVPRLAELLHDGPTNSEPIARILAQVAHSHPDALLPVVTKLELFLETEPDTAHVSVLAAIGHLSKEHPTIAKETIPTATELLTVDDTLVRANATGLLADLADEYPTEIKSTVPQAIELLQDKNERIRYNASSILARVADEHPQEVEPATDQLLAALDDEKADTRFNACWALNYIGSEEALEKLTDVAETDPEDNVRTVALQCINAIKE